MPNQKSGYFYVQPIQPNVFSTATISELFEQIESCGYRCEAGPLENNLAFIELKRRADLPEVKIMRDT